MYAIQVIYIYYDLVQLILFTKYARYWTFFLASSLICFGHPSGHFPPWWSSWHRRWLRRQTRRWCSCYLWLTHWTSGKKTCLGNKSMEICGRKIWEQRNLRIVEKKSGKSMELWEEKWEMGTKIWDQQWLNMIKLILNDELVSKTARKWDQIYP